MASAATIARRAKRHADGFARATESFVETPEDLAYDLAGWPFSDIAMLPPGATVLEPSAGRNAIVRQILEHNRHVHITAVEPNADRSAQDRPQPLDEWGHPTEYRVDYVTATFEDYAAANPGRTFHAVVMNPPFTLLDQAAAWIDHVRLAWDMLKPGGRLVAVVPGSFKYRNQAAYKEFRELVGAHGGCRALNADAFKDSGTNVSTMVIWMVKPLPGDRPAWLVPTYTGRETPTRVEHFNVSGEAAVTTPVQISLDRSWGLRGDRVLRFMGQCATPECRHMTWAFADGENDPRGPLGMAAADPLEAEACGMVGPTVALCFNCANDGDIERDALKFARTYWVEAPAAPIPPAITDEPGPVTYRDEPTETATYAEPETLFSMTAV